IKRGDYVIRVNNRKVLDGVMEAIGLGGDDKAGQRLNVLRAIDKLDKFGIEGVRLLLGEGRKDESGDFTKGAGLDEQSISSILKLIFVQELSYRPLVDDEDDVRELHDLFRRMDTEAFGPVRDYPEFAANVRALIA